MIELRQERGERIWINPVEIASMYRVRGSIGMSPPVTAVRLRDGSKYDVLETPEEIAAMMLDPKQPDRGATA